MKRFLACGMLLIMANLARSQNVVPSPPPFLFMVESVDLDKKVIATVQALLLPKTVQREVLVVTNGQTVKQIVNETVMERVVRTASMDIKAGRFIGTDGKNVPHSEVAKRLKAKTVIAVSGDANVPGEAFLRALSPECLIYVPPSSTSNGFIPPVPVTPVVPAKLLPKM